MKRTVLVTGGSGFIGSHVVDALLAQGHRVINLDLKPPHRADVEFRQGSILDRGLIGEVVGACDAVYHIGGFSNINLVKDDPVQAIELNVMSTVFLLDACRRVPGKTPQFVYASSVYVFDRNGHLYTTSKAASERIIEDYRQLYGVPYTILRYGTVYGPRSRRADVVYLFVKNAFEGRALEIHGDGSQSRNFIDVRDLATASVNALDNAGAANTSLSIAHPRRVSILQLANKVKRIVNKRVEIRTGGAAREQDYQGGVDALRVAGRILKWRPRIGIEQGIRDVYAEVSGRSEP